MHLYAAISTRCSELSLEYLIKICLSVWICKDVHSTSKLINKQNVGVDNHQMLPITHWYHTSVLQSMKFKLTCKVSCCVIIDSKSSCKICRILKARCPWRNCTYTYDFWNEVNVLLLDYSCFTENKTGQNIWVRVCKKYWKYKTCSQSARVRQKSKYRLRFKVGPETGLFFSLSNYTYIAAYIHKWIYILADP